MRCKPARRLTWAIPAILFAGALAAEDNRAYVVQFYQRFDKNSDGILEPNEWKTSRSSDAVERAIEDAGLDPDKPVSLKTLVDARLKGSSRSSRDDKESERGYRSTLASERLAGDVPDWFRERDRDQDGQVAMAEYAKDWTDKLVEEFLELDVNRDGLITPAESLGGESSSRSSVASNRSTRGRDDSRQDTSRSSSSPRDRSDSSESDSDSESGSDKVAGGSAGEDGESTEGIPENVLGYARVIVKKYDTDSSGYLTKNEWSEMSRDPSPSDANRDKRVTYIEYARWLATK